MAQKTQAREKEKKQVSFCTATLRSEPAAIRIQVRCNVISYEFIILLVCALWDITCDTLEARNILPVIPVTVIPQVSPVTAIQVAPVIAILQVAPAIQVTATQKMTQLIPAIHLASRLLLLATPVTAIPQQVSPVTARLKVLGNAEELIRMVRATRKKGMEIPMEKVKNELKERKKTKL